MHAKTDSEGTSIDASWPPRSPRRPVYYVQSPSNHDAEKMSYGSSPTASPINHHYYHCSPIHHSRESSTSRFSASLKNPRNLSAWKHVQIGHGGDDDDEDDDGEMDGRDGRKANNIRLYLCLVFLFCVLFAVFSLILWGASRSYQPKIFVKVRFFFFMFCKSVLLWVDSVLALKLILLCLVHWTFFYRVHSVIVVAFYLKCEKQ